ARNFHRHRYCTRYNRQFRPRLRLHRRRFKPLQP
ncbi:Homoserine kinase, partial [uncultured Microcoleus sp.]